MGHKRRNNAVRLSPVTHSPSPTLNSERLNALSKPKQLQDRWLITGSPTHVGLNVRWGSQQTLRPIPRKIPMASERVVLLSKPKRNFRSEDIKPLYFYSAGRPSFITEPKTVKEANDRVKELASPKPTHSRTDTVSPQFYYGCGRPSIVGPRLKPLIKKASIRVEELARPKRLHEQHVLHREMVQPINFSSSKPR